MPYKESFSNARLFTCEEGVTSLKMNSYVPLPSFPYPQPDPKNVNMWNCYPLNSIDLTDPQKKQCFENKDRTGAGSCQEALRTLKNPINDYYCCQGGK
jgi:hypothetical protein